MPRNDGRHGTGIVPVIHTVLLACTKCGKQEIVDRDCEWNEGWFYPSSATVRACLCPDCREAELVALAFILAE
jgi:hypothetical protein